MNKLPNKPLYYKLKQTILKWIEDEKYLPGDLLPSEKQLQLDFDVSRTTVRLALNELELEGFIVRSPGRGTFVARLKMESGPRRLLSFTDELISLGLKPSSQILSFDKEVPAIKIAKMLEIKEKQPIWRLERIRLADNVPVASEINYIPSLLVNNLDVNLLKYGSLYKYLENEHNIITTYAKERVEARLANARESKQLAITKGSPVLYVERLTYGYAKGRPMEKIPIELVKIVYNAEKYTFTIHIKND